MLVNFCIEHVERYVPQIENTTYIIEGAKSFNQLFPVSKLTGLRENPLSLLMSLEADVSKRRALADMFMELQPLNMAKVSVDDMLASLKSRLDSGTFFDDDVYRERLQYLAESIESQFKEEIVKKKEKANSVPSDSVLEPQPNNSTLAE